MAELFSFVNAYNLSRWVKPQQHLHLKPWFVSPPLVGNVDVFFGELATKVLVIQCEAPKRYQLV